MDIIIIYFSNETYIGHFELFVLFCDKNFIWVLLRVLFL